MRRNFKKKITRENKNFSHITGGKRIINPKLNNMRNKLLLIKNLN
jgi:hypothetical protein